MQAAADRLIAEGRADRRRDGQSDGAAGRVNVHIRCGGKPELHTARNRRYIDRPRGKLFCVDRA